MIKQDSSFLLLSFSCLAFFNFTHNLKATETYGFNQNDSVTIAIEQDQELSTTADLVIDQIDHTLFRLQQLAQQVASKIVVVSNKEDTLNQLMQTITFCQELKGENEKIHDKSKLQQLLETETALIYHLWQAINNGLEPFTAFNDSSTEFIKHNPSKMNVDELKKILEQNDCLLNLIDQKSRFLGLSSLNKAALSTEYFLKKIYINKLYKRGWPYLLLGHWWLLSSSQETIDNHLGSLSSYKKSLDTFFAELAQTFSAPETDTLTKSTKNISGGIVELNSKALFSLGIGGVVMPHLKQDFKDLSDLSSRWYIKAMAKIKGLPQPTDPIKPPKGNFNKLIGLKGPKAQMQPAIAYLSDPDAFLRTGKKAHRGYLFIGPRYSGKRSLADAIAGEVTEQLKANHDFLKANGNNDTCKVYEIHASKLLESPLSSVLKEALKATPCIVVITNIEWLNMKDQKSIGAIVGAMTKYFKEKKEGIIIATTSDPDAINPALLESGRISAQVYVDYPDQNERIQFIEKKLNENGIASNQFSLDTLGLATHAQSYSALNTFIEQLFSYASATQQPITPELFETIVNREIYNIIEHQVVQSDEIHVLAAHYAGQAIAHLLKNPAAKLTKVTILPVVENGKRIFGKRFTYAKYQLVAENYENMKKECSILLASEIAQEIILGEKSASPLTSTKKQAHDLALKIILDGADEKLLSKGAVNKARDAAHELITTLAGEVRELLLENEDALRKVAHELEKKEILSAHEILALI